MYENYFTPSRFTYLSAKGWYDQPLGLWKTSDQETCLVHMDHTAEHASTGTDQAQQGLPQFLTIWGFLGRTAGMFTEFACLLFVCVGFFILPFTPWKIFFFFMVLLSSLNFQNQMTLWENAGMCLMIITDLLFSGLYPCSFYLKITL